MESRLPRSRLLIVEGTTAVDGSGDVMLGADRRAPSGGCGGLIAAARSRLLIVAAMITIGATAAVGSG
jgi:hypothetical protein